MRKLLAVLVLVACSEITAPPSDTALEITPIPAHYRVWWDELESCAKLSGDIDRVRFYADESQYMGQTPEGKPARAYAQRGSRPFIVFFKDARHYEGVVKHEMLHILLGEGGHPVEYFGAPRTPGNLDGIDGVCGNLWYAGERYSP